MSTFADRSMHMVQFGSLLAYFFELRGINIIIIKLLPMPSYK